MKKYQFVLGICFTVLVVGSYVAYDQPEQTAISTQKEITTEQNMDNLEFTKIESVGFAVSKNYSSIKEVEEYADLIVIATKQSSGKQNSKNTTEFDPMGEFWVDTTFEVHKVVKGEFKEKEIVVAEPIYVEDDKVFAHQGYSPAQKNMKYVLYLKKSEFGVKEEGGFAWNTVSLNFGKYNIDGKDTFEDELSKEGHKKIKEKVKKKYKN